MCNLPSSHGKAIQHSRSGTPSVYIRIKQGKPFDITGVDFTGALYVKTLQGEDKVYICLFTCGLTRAVHLEVVTDLNVETFMQAFRRFVCRKSLPQVMISDNASTYTSAAKELEQLLTATKLNETLSLRGVRWQFIPKSPLVWRVLGAANWDDKEHYKEGVGKIIHYLVYITNPNCRDRSYSE